MKFWLWRMPALFLGLAMLGVIFDVGRVAMLLILLGGALSVTWQRKEVVNEVERIIAQVEANRPTPQISMAGWFKEGWDMARSKPQAVYEETQNKQGRGELIVYETSTTADRRKAHIPVLRVGADYYNDMLADYVRKTDKPAVPALRH